MRVAPERFHYEVQFPFQMVGCYGLDALFTSLQSKRSWTVTPFGFFTQLAQG
jgi:hypothetical protein